MLCSGASASDWPQFRGTKFDGISTESGWKDKGDLKTAWTAEVGMGHASFVIADGRAFTTGNNGTDTDTVWCFDEKTGKVIWKQSYPHPLDNIFYTGGTTSTPTIDGDVIYHIAKRGQLYCFAAATGEIQWRVHLAEDFGMAIMAILMLLYL